MKHLEASGHESGFLSIDQVAARLGLHVRTVRRYVREGRLGAVRIGKQYRVTREALDALTGRPAAAAAPVVGPEARHIEVSIIMHVDGVDADTAARVSSGLMSAVNGRPEEPVPLRIDTVYDPARARLKVILNGSAATTAGLLKFVNAYLEA